MDHALLPAARALLQGFDRSRLEYAGQDFFSREGTGGIGCARIGSFVRVRDHSNSIHTEYFRHPQSQDRSTQPVDFSRWQTPGYPEADESRMGPVKSSVTAR